MKQEKLLSFHSRVVKNINEHLVLKLIQEHEIISSSDLVNLTGMRPSTIFNILKELSAKSFVSFYGKGESTKKGGKKPYIWNLNKDAACVIGLDIEVGEITCVVLDFSGSVIARKIIKLESGKTSAELINNIIIALEGVIIENKIDEEKILGLGVAFAGIVDARRGVVAMSSVMEEMNVPLHEPLSKFPFPVMIENNANAAALGIKWRSKDKNEKNYLTTLVEIDKNVSGLGIGIVIDGRLYHGASFCAGELYPHMPTLREILMNFRSRFDESEILKKYIGAFEDIDIKVLLDAAKEGDEIAKMIFTVIGNVVGQTIAPAVALLNPDTLIISGVVSELGDLIIDAVRKEIEMRIVSIANKTLNITADAHHQYSVAVGAASLILEDFFKVPTMR